MITRDWIFETLAKLDVRHWAVFLWELYWIGRYLDALRAEHSSGLIGLGVCRKGRIYITLQAFGDEPVQDDWTLFAPRAPWERFAPALVVQTLSGDGCGLVLLVVLTRRTSNGGSRAPSGPSAQGQPDLKPP